MKKHGRTFFNYQIKNGGGVIKQEKPSIYIEIRNIDNGNQLQNLYTHSSDFSVRAFVSFQVLKVVHITFI